MRKFTGSYPSLIVDTTAKRVVSHAGAVLLAGTAGKVGLDRELSAALRPWMDACSAAERVFSNAVSPAYSPSPLAVWVW